MPAVARVKPMKITLLVSARQAELLLCRYAVRTLQVPHHNLTWRQLRKIVAEEIQVFAIGSLDGWADEATEAEQAEAQAWAARQISANHHHLAVTR